MKRMSPDRRGMVLEQFLEGIKREWLCKHGKWNRDKLLQELEKKLRSERMSK